VKGPTSRASSEAKLKRSIPQHIICTTDQGASIAWSSRLPWARVYGRRMRQQARRCADWVIPVDTSYSRSRRSIKGREHARGSPRLRQASHDRGDLTAR